MTLNGKNPRMYDHWNEEVDDDQPVRNILPQATVVYVLREHDESGYSNESKSNNNPINLEGHILQFETKHQAKDVNDSPPGVG